MNVITGIKSCFGLTNDGQMLLILSMFISAGLIAFVHLYWVKIGISEALRLRIAQLRALLREMEAQVAEEDVKRELRVLSDGLRAADDRNDLGAFKESEEATNQIEDDFYRLKALRTNRCNDITKKLKWARETINGLRADNIVNQTSPPSDQAFKIIKDDVEKILNEGEGGLKSGSLEEPEKRAGRAIDTLKKEFNKDYDNDIKIRIYTKYDRGGCIVDCLGNGFRDVRWYLGDEVIGKSEKFTHKEWQSTTAMRKIRVIYGTGVNEKIVESYIVIYGRYKMGGSIVFKKLWFGVLASLIVSSIGIPFIALNPLFATQTPMVYGFAVIWSIGAYTVLVVLSELYRRVCRLG